MRQASIGAGAAGTAPDRISSELHVLCSHATAMSMQPHPYQRIHSCTMVDGGWLPAREECKPRRVQRV